MRADADFGQSDFGQKEKKGLGYRACTFETHQRAKNETTRNAPLSEISDSPTKSGPRAWPKLAEPKSVF